MTLTLGITDDDVLQARIVEPGTYEVVGVNLERKLAKDGKSYNWIVDVKIENHPVYEGVPLRRYVNEQRSADKIELARFLGMDGGAGTNEVDESNFNKHHGKAKVKTGEYQDKSQNEIAVFLPAGS